MKSNITLLSMISVLTLFSCVETNSPTIAKEKAYVPFSTLMITSKTIVQEVLIAAYQNPDLNDFNSIGAENRTNCPSELDLNPNEFPKTMVYTYEEDCLTDAGTEMSGSIEVVITDRIGAPDMEIKLIPQEGFKVEGQTISLNDADADFKAVFTGNEKALENYNLIIKGLVSENRESGRFELIEMENGEISFEDVAENNDSEINTGPTKYFDDLAVIHFSNMQFSNNERELLNANLQSDIKFDLLCNCPLAGKINIVKANSAEESQIVDYTANATCVGEILVDVEVVTCK